MAAALFLSAGTLHWMNAWWFMGVFLFLTLIAVAWLWRVNPDIFVARKRPTGRGTKSWDVIVLFVLLASFVATLIVAGLDAGRFHWAPAPGWAVLLGYVLLVVGYVGTGWAQAVNRHFETSVRIQSDRDHRVVATGPYALVRHPGYAFAIVLTFGIALALGSLWALLPAVLVVVVLLVRTVLEDATRSANRRAIQSTRPVPATNGFRGFGKALWPGATRALWRPPPATTTSTGPR